MRIGMVCEAPADHRTATTLATRVLNRDIVTTAIDPTVDQDPEFSRWSKLNRHRRQWPRYHLNGRRGGSSPVHGQTLAARKALLLFSGKVDAVILMLDGDDEAEARRAAIERARTESQIIEPDRIVVAVPKPEREAWHIVGFEPVDENDRDRLREEEKALGGDPRTNTHTLKHGVDTAKRNAKRVLNALVGNDADREQACITDPDLEVLRRRGDLNGLNNFLDQVGQRLAAI